ncbi:flavocytochrome c [Clostridiisalibacter paucivorans]|uniref:flavocytochrome c n=1 Tax=Clostridiisalibacter paucivorans TaxID=408753 RepID=UPI00047D0A90|nr:flavocytochrome c [Clostridiisalibacter paucivorans]
MKKFRTLLVLVLSIAMLLTAFGCQSNEPTSSDEGEESSTTFNAGTYMGEAQGHNGTLKVEVVLSEDKIEEVNVVEHSETPQISDVPLNQIPETIVKNQSLAVDTISGATVTSDAVLTAVTKALEGAGVEISALSQTVSNESTEPKEMISKSADVVVIGGGGAGLSAAVAAGENGGKVILIEKMPMLGGNTIRSGGAYNSADPERQKEQGIEDSIDKHFKQTYEGGDKAGDSKLVKIMVENGLDGKHWLESYGMEFRNEIGSVVGSLWPRTHQAVKPAGTGYIETLEKAAKEYGVEIITNVKAKEIIKDESGRVIGVKAENVLDKTPMEIMGEKGVILASGGFAANVEMRTKYVPSLTADKPTTNHPGATGDGIVMAEDVGAQLVGMEHIQLLPMAIELVGPTINVENSIFVNKEGKRFINEDNRRDKLCEAILAQTDGQYYMINDSQVITGPNNETGQNIEELIEEGIIVKADTIEDLAQKINIESNVLKDTVDKFNKSVDEQKDEFGRKLWKNKVEKAPFYATLRYPAVHHTMGGVKINEKTQVLDANDEIIPGFYAAGEITGGIHGTNRLGGNALLDIVVFGRISGENIMNQ